MTRDEAVEILNKYCYGQNDNWQAVEDDCVLGGPNLERDIFIHDAIFIAEALELRAATEPFAYYAAVMIGDYEGYTDEDEIDGICLGAWRAIAGTV